MRFTADITASRTFSIEIEADDTEKANDSVLEMIDKRDFFKDSGCKESVTVSFKKKEETV